MRFARALPSMRERVLARAIMAQVRRANSRFWRVVHFSLQATHVHLVVEIENETELARAMKGLGVRVAKRVNRILRRKGNVVSGRFHVHPLRTPREVRHAIAYVICNAHKHRAISSGWDPWSSAAWFEGWSRPLGEGAERYRERVPIPVARAQTWLLSTGWRLGGPISGLPR
jgi:REP element-mobilizing transposase RayT